jgi:RNA recognition motif-containing protein
MGKMLLVEDFPESCMDQQLGEFFAPFGQVVAARVVRRHTGESLRFGFVEMGSEGEAVRAQQALHRTWLEGQTLIVTLQEKPSSSSQPKRSDSDGRDA